MKFGWTSSNKYIIKFLVSLFILGIIIGAFAYYHQGELVRSGILNELENIEYILSTTRQNNFLGHIIFFSVAIIASLIIIGLPLLLFYFFYEAVSIGFLLASFFDLNGISGLFFGLIFTIVSKLFLYLGLIYLTIISINYAKKMIISIKMKDNKIYEHITHHTIRSILVLIFILITNLFSFFLANIIMVYFLFLL